MAFRLLDPRESAKPRSSAKSSRIRLQGASPAASSPPESQSDNFMYHPFSPRTRMGCLDGLPTVSTGVGQNSPQAITGSLDVDIAGKGRSAYKYDEKSQEYSRLVFARGKAVRDEESGRFCFCDCMKYRQYIRGAAWVNGSPIQNIASGTHSNVKLDGNWYEEGTSVTLDSQVGCKRKQHDEPGVTNGLSPGDKVELRYNLMLQVWDTCREVSMWEEHLTMTIRVNSGTRIVRWAKGQLGLTPADIAQTT